MTEGHGGRRGWLPQLLSERVRAFPEVSGLSGRPSIRDMGVGEGARQARVATCQVQGHQTYSVSLDMAGAGFRCLSREHEGPLM